MAWVVGGIYGLVMFIAGIFIADLDWTNLMDEPELYECSYFDAKDVCQAKMKLKRKLLNETHHKITIGEKAQ